MTASARIGLFRSETINLTTDLSRTECVKRLTAQVDGNLRIFGTKPLVGRIRESSLRVARRIRYRNSFQTWLSANLIDAGGGTRLICRLALHPLVRIFMIVWFTGIILIGGLIGLGAGAGLMTTLLRGTGPLSPGPVLATLVPLGLLGFGLGLLKFSRYLARDERDFLVSFIKDTLAARED